MASRIGGVMSGSSGSFYNPSNNPLSDADRVELWLKDRDLLELGWGSSPLVAMPLCPGNLCSQAHLLLHARTQLLPSPVKLLLWECCSLVGPLSHLKWFV